jgi:hypothetical protein
MSTTLSVAWQAATDPDNASNTLHYEVWRRVSGVGSFALVQTTGVNVLSVIDSGLAQGTSYDYEVRAIDPLGSAGTFSDPATGATTPADVATMNISWPAATDPDDTSVSLHYQLQRKLGTAGTYGDIFISGNNVLGFNDTGLKAGTQYCYHVRSIDPDGLFSAYTADSCAVTQSLAQPQNITLTGLASLEVFGTQQLDATGSDDVTLTGIASLLAFGTHKLQSSQLIHLSGIASQENLSSSPASGVWDDPTITWSDPVDPWNGVFATGLVVTISANAPISLSGISSGEVFGAQRILNAASLTLSGIGSQEAFGAPSVNNPAFLFPSGIASALAFGLAQIGVTGSAFIDLLGNGIPSAQAFGSQVISPTGSDNITLTGIPTANVFGSDTLTNPPAIFITLSGIPTGEVFGVPLVTASGNVFIQPSGIASAEAFGTQSIGPTGSANISPAGIFSLEAIGIQRLQLGGIILSGIPSGEAFGNPTLHRVNPSIPMARVL